MALTKLTTDLIDGSLGTDWQTTPKTTNFPAVAGEGYFVNTTSAAITVTLPSSPSAGDEVSIVDYGANASTNNITITSSDNIEGAADDLTLSTDKVSKTLVYSDATKGWLIINDTEGLAPAASFSVDYLVVAGGGGGSGSAGGAGGAGGLRTSYGSTQGGGQSSETSLSLTLGTSYNVTVGLGGNGGTPTNSWNSTNGGNSEFSTITSIGGGYGSSNQYSPYNGNDGGSGGGGATTAGNNVFGSAVTSPVIHGYDGGANNGGGGAGSAGTGGSNGKAGNGGAGLSVAITGISVIYAGGGGASGETSAGAGGSGGGGNGGFGTTSNGQNGTDGLGGGGGGAWNTASGMLGGNGGSGVVILRYPNTYTVTIGSGLTGTTDTDGSDKVTTFTAGTGTISFS